MADTKPRTPRGESTVAVQRDGTFGTEARLSEGQSDGSEILSTPGSYRVGVVDADISERVGPNTSIFQSEFQNKTTDSRPINVFFE